MKYFKLDSKTVVSLRGADRTALLQRLCTQDLRLLPKSKVVESFLTDVKGKTLAHGWIIDGSEELLVVVSGELADKLVGHIDRYVIREDVIPVNESSKWSWFVVERGGLSLLGLEFDTESDLAIPKSVHATSTIQMTGIRTDAYTSDYCIAGCHTENLDDFYALMKELGGVLGDRLERERLRIEGGWPEFGVDFDGTALPQEIDRDAKAISFTKGCYLGQETIARLDALGQVQKKLLRLRIPNSCEVGLSAKIYVGENEAGWVTSQAYSKQENDVILFGFIKRSFHGRATSFSIDGHPATFL